MNKERAQEIVNRILELSTADATIVHLNRADSRATRYANNAVTQSQESVRNHIYVSAAFDNRVGSASVEDDADISLEEVVRRAEQNARLSKPDPEYMPPLEPIAYPEINAYHPSVEGFDAQRRVAAIGTALAVCRSEGQKGAGVFIVNDNHSAVGNSRGLFAYNRRSEANFTITAMTENSSGWAEECGEDADQIDCVRAAKIASLKAKVCMNPHRFEARKCTVLLEPAAVADLALFMMWFYDARAADENRSVFSGKRGELIAHPRVNMFSDPLYPLLPGSPFQADGLPAPKVHWVRDGRAETMITSRFWAQKTGVPVSGYPTNIIMQCGSDDYQDMIAGIGDGLLITRFWYIRTVDFMSLLLTGMTRDSTCRIENGKQSFGILNLRFNESPLNMLSNIIAASGPKRIGTRHIPAMIPALLVKDFNFTSETLF